MSREMTLKVTDKAAGEISGMMAFLELDEEEFLDYAFALLKLYIQQLREGKITASINLENKSYKELSLGDLKEKIGDTTTES